jgi:DNA polymerase I
VHLEFDGRYAAMLSHEPKNYALLTYAGAVVLRGVAFRSSRYEAYGEAFLRRALAGLLRGDVASVRRAYVAQVLALSRREVPTRDVTARVRLTKSPAEYEATRKVRREKPYEALLAHGQRQWQVGERISVYRATGGRAALLRDEPDDDLAASESAFVEAGRPSADPRDYDVSHYLRLLKDTFAARLARALTPGDFAAVVADPEQPSLFDPDLASARPILSVLSQGNASTDGSSPEGSQEAEKTEGKSR